MLSLDCAKALAVLILHVPVLCRIWMRSARTLETTVRSGGYARTSANRLSKPGRCSCHTQVRAQPLSEFERRISDGAGVATGPSWEPIRIPPATNHIQRGPEMRSVETVQGGFQGEMIDPVEPA
ncbi:hypothetical protein LY78DRAFT_651767 [Colletotrichum sublineola]|nr:hypothetical protein LY78DRAFT_651767 [Colletotrichum sublineola]